MSNELFIKQLAIDLKLNGYKVVTKNNSYQYWDVTGKNITGFFSGDSSYLGPAMLNTLIVDNVKCFDKLSKCPVRIPINENLIFADVLLVLKWIASEEGYLWSNTFEYLDSNRTFGSITIGCAD
jgi:hypothetical protein